MSNIPDYLKKYLSNDDSSSNKQVKKKKSKSKSNTSSSSRSIIKDIDDEESITVGNRSTQEKKIKAKYEEYNPVIANEDDYNKDEIDSIKKDTYEKGTWISIENDNKSKETDLSPPRGRNRDLDISPPRNRNRDTDQSPPRNRSRDVSPPRNRNRDLSPPRGRNRDVDVSPRNRNRDTDQSPPRYNRDTDQSPPRNRNRDISPPRNRNRDLSPPRNNRDTDQSPPRNRNSSSRENEDLSPPRNKDNDKDDIEKNNALPANLRLKMSFGAEAGLHSAKTIREQAVKRVQDQKELFRKADKALLGRDAQTVYRDASGKRLSQAELDRAKQKEKDDAAAEAEQKRALNISKVQREQREEQMRLLEEARDQPFSKFADDDQINNRQKDRDIWGDPMAQSNSSSKTKKRKKDEKPKYNGPAAPSNRFGIKPGYRWDGVHRSNGFEKEYFRAQSKASALKDESYLWSVEDM